MKRESAPGRFLIVRIPGEKGAIVHRMEVTAEDPSTVELEVPDDAIIQTVPGRSALTEKPIDKDSSPYYEQLSDGTFRFTGL